MQYIFIFSLFKEPLFFVQWSFIVIFSICLHELVHAFVAKKMGDTTAADAGHISMNPLRQMGFASLITFLLTGIAWGQVPVNPARLKPWYKEVLVALAGPLTNFVLGVLCSILGFALDLAGHFDVISVAEAKMFIPFAALGSTLNMAMFILNMMPIPGLDGWHMIAPLVNGTAFSRTEAFSAVAFGLMLAVFLLINEIYMAADYLAGFISWCLKQVFLLFL